MKRKKKPNRLNHTDMVVDLLVAFDPGFFDHFRVPFPEYWMGVRVCAEMASNQVIAGAAKIGKVRLYGKE